jgi:hypothetical protein
MRDQTHDGHNSVVDSTENQTRISHMQALYH